MILRTNYDDMPAFEIDPFIESESKVIHYDGSEPRIEKGVNLDI